MKRFKKVALTLLSSALMVAPLLTSCSNDGGEGGSSQATVSVKSIAITTQPNKVDYESGDIFDPTGMVVTATMSDGSTQEVKDYTYSKMPLQESDTQVKIMYKGKTAYVKITVKFVKKMTSMSIEDKPTKMKYVVGERFDPTGMKVVGIFNDNTKKVVTDYDYDKKDPLTLADTVVTITSGTFKVQLTIEIAEEKVNGIEVTTAPTKLAYLVGETFDPTGMVVSTVSNAGNKVALESSAYTIDKTAPLTLEDTSVKITYQNFETTLAISVAEVRLTGIRIGNEFTKKEYWEGEKLNTSGLEVFAQYEDGTEKKLENGDYTIDKDVLAKEDAVVTITYGGFSKTIAIVVKEKVVSVKVDALKTVRVEAEHLDTSKAALRQDFIAAGRTFIENGAGASNGQNICGYNPGSLFQIPLTSDKDFEVIITARMSDTNLDYKINDGVKFTMDDELMKANDVEFTYEGKGDYWNWKDVYIGKLSLKAGSHMFQLEAINQRPNLDCFDFQIVKYGDQSATKQMTGITMSSAPTKLQYEAGETFDPTGMVIEATYDDHTSEVVTDYTIDKTGPLTEDDDKVTVTYNGFSLDIAIQVGKKYTVKINALGEKKIEAEDLDFTDLIHRDDMPTPGYVVNNSLASGGASIERYATGSKLTISIFAGEDSKSKFIIAASDAGNYKFDSAVTVKLDDTVITSSNPTLASASGNPYYNWQMADFGVLELAKGEHTITIEFTGNHPNLDYVSFETVKYANESVEKVIKDISIETEPTKMDYLVGETFDPTGMVVKANYSDGTSEEVTGYNIDKTGALTLDDKTITITYEGKTATLTIRITTDAVVFTASEAKTYTIEAETLDFSTLIGDAAGVKTESCGSYGNGTSVGHIAGGYLDIAFNVTEEMNLVVDMMAAKFEPVKVSTLISSFSLDGTTLEYEDITLGKADGNDWFNFKAAPVTCGKVSVGRHVFRVNFKGGPNLDAFNFKFTK